MGLSKKKSIGVFIRDSAESSHTSILSYAFAGLYHLVVKTWDRVILNRFQIEEFLPSEEMRSESFFFFWRRRFCGFLCDFFYIFFTFKRILLIPWGHAAVSSLPLGEPVVDKRVHSPQRVVLVDPVPGERVRGAVLVREPLLHHLGDLGRGDEAGRLRGQFETRKKLKSKTWRYPPSNRDIWESWKLREIVERRVERL